MPGKKDFRDIEEVAGQPIAVSIGGKEYILSPLSLRDHAEARNHLRTQAWEVYLGGLKSLPANLIPPISEQREQVAKILNARLTDEELFGFYNTLEGLQYMIWQSLRHKHRDITLEEVESMLTDRTQLEALTTAIAEMTGLRAEEGEEGEQGANPPASSPSGSQTSPSSVDSTDGQ